MVLDCGEASYDTLTLLFFMYLISFVSLYEQAYPYGSEDFDGGHSKGIECTRGHGAWLYRWLFFCEYHHVCSRGKFSCCLLISPFPVCSDAPIWFVIVAVTIIMIMLTRSVKAEEKRFIEMVQKHNCSQSPGHHPVEGGSASLGAEENLECASERVCDMRPDAFHLARSQKMFSQALFYVAAFYITWYVDRFRSALFIFSLTNKNSCCIYISFH